MGSVKWAARTQNGLTVAKLAGIAVLIVGGIVNIAINGVDDFKSGTRKLEYNLYRDYIFDFRVHTSG